MGALGAGGADLGEVAAGLPAELVEPAVHVVDHPLLQGELGAQSRLLVLGFAHARLLARRRPGPASV
ncbi:hypothetical protein [Salana multivorans]